MSKSILIIDTPSSCENCPLCILLDLYRCTVNKRYCGDEQGYFTSSTKPSWCPLKEYKEAIPIGWIKKWKEKAADGSLCCGPLDLFDHYEYEAAINRLLSDWERENETCKCR